MVDYDENGYAAELKEKPVSRFCLTQNDPLTNIYTRKSNAISQASLPMQIMACVSIEEMKQMLYNAIEQAPSAELVEPDFLKRYYATFDEQFFHRCDKELAKINTFYSEKLAEATRKFANLRTELSEALEDGYDTKKSLSRSKKLLRKQTKPARKVQELKLAFSEFYLGLILLQNYQTLNFTGFRKILKKHDKLLNVDFGAKWRIDHVEIAHFHVNKDIDRLINDTESIVTQDIEGGDRQKAMKRLRVPPLNEQQSPWITFKVGIFSGAFIVLMATVILTAVFRQNKDRDPIVSQIGIRLFRGPLLIIGFLFLWGLNVYGWRSAGVNHVLIFEIDPRNHLSEQSIMEFGACFGVIWTLCVLSFQYSDALSIPTYASPLTLYILMALFLFNPTKTLRHEARFWTIRVLWRIFLAPFYYVSFADFFVADQLNSIVPAFLDLQFLVCFYYNNANLQTASPAEVESCVEGSYLIRPMVAMLPAWFRFAQCIRRYRDTKEAFPHLANALKYSTSFFVVIFSSLSFVTGKLNRYQRTNWSYELDLDNLLFFSSGILSGSHLGDKNNPYFYLWIVASIISSCYAYAWDVKFDWGLLEMKSRDNKFLREETVYSSNLFYYFGMVEDLILRFGWTLSMSLVKAGYVEGEQMMTILSPFEVFRRFIWNYFRLENEHLNNCGIFRAVRDISVAPLDCSDQVTILRMMDEDNGVIHRRPKTKLIKKKSELRMLFQAESADEIE